MTPEQENQFQHLIDSGYTYYDEAHGDIIMTRPSAYEGPDSIHVSINGRGTIANYKGENDD